MRMFFAHMYEWFGLIRPYSHDFGEYLRGWDFACVGYFAVPWCLYVGWLMVIVTLVIFGLQFDLVSAKRFNQRQHWGLVAFSIVIVNFLIAAGITVVAIYTGSYCLRLQLSILDCIGFGISNALWSFIFFSLLSAISPLRDQIISWRKPTFKKD